MKSSRKNTIEKVSQGIQEEQTVEVLYQKMGDRWFAFSLINDDVFVGSISQNEIENGSSKTNQNEINVNNDYSAYCNANLNNYNNIGNQDKIEEAIAQPEKVPTLNSKGINHSP